MSDFCSTELESSLEIQLHQLERLHQEFSKSYSLRSSFRSDYEAVIEDMLADLRSSRAKVVEAANIGMVFVSNYQTAHTDFLEKSNHFDKLTEIAEDQQTKIHDLQRENYQQASKIDYLTSQTSDLESVIKQISSEKDNLQRQMHHLKSEKNRIEEQILIKQNTIGITHQIQQEEVQASQLQLEETIEKLKKSQDDVKHLQFKLREVESLHQIERNASDKLRKTVGKLREENKGLTRNVEEVKRNYKTLESFSKKYQEDLSAQRSYYEDKMREAEFLHARSRKGSNADRNENRHEDVKKSFENAESLGDFIEEDIDKPHENQFFLISSPKADFNGFKFDNQPDLCLDYLDEIQIYALQKWNNLVQGQEAVVVFPMLKLEHHDPVAELHTQHGPPVEVKPRVVQLSVEVVEDIGVTSQNLENFSDAGSVDSDDSGTSRGSAKGPLNVRDPIMDFFVLVRFK